MPTQSLGFVSLAPRGDWDADTTYKRLDTVNYGGSSYIVLKALTGVIPTGDNVNYMLLASKGDNAFQVWLLQPGNEGKTYEDYEAWLRQPATDAGGRADEAANKAQGAADNANNAATTAQEAAQNANTAAEEARTNAASAENAASAAREATNNANNAATLANAAAENANQAAGTIDDKISLMGRIIESTVEDIDDTPGFWSSGFGPNTKGTKPTAVGYGSVCQVSNTINSPMTGGQTWVFQFAHLHGVDRPYWRSQYNNIGWSDWKQVALMDDVMSKLSHIPDIVDANNVSENGAGRTGAVTINTPTSGLGGYLVNYIWDVNASHQMFFSLDTQRCFTRIKIGGEWQEWKQVALMEDISPVGAIRFDQVLDAQKVVVEPGAITRRVIDCTFKAGQGYTSRAAIGLVNKSSKFSPVVISAGVSDDGTEWADWIFNPDNGRIITPDGKTMAINEDVISAISWLSGTDYGPRLDVIRRGGTDPVSAIIPRASTTESGVVTTIAQAFAGRKSFNAGIDITAGGMSVNGGIAVDNGTIACTGEISAANGFYETSDIRLKKNITPVQLSENRIRLYEFDKSGRHSYGVIAQEVERLYPSTVKVNEEGHKVVNYIEILTIKCAEQDERIKALEKENQELKDRLERLEKLLLK